MAKDNRPVGALVDLGTNSARLVIARLEDDGVPVILKQEKYPVSLGDGSFETHVLTKEAMDRTFLALKSVVETAGFFGANYIRAVATSALRQADNREEFIKKVYRELGLDLKVIPGLEEARLVYQGVAYNLTPSDAPSLILDIGGGSAELIVKGPKTFLELDSLPLGGARIADRFNLYNNGGLVSKALYREIGQYVVNRIRLFKEKVGRYNLKICYGCAGTLENLARVQAKRVGREEKLQKFPHMAAKELEDLGLWLGSMTVEERKKVKGLDREKAPIIVAGCAVADAILNDLDIQTLEVVDYGLKHGLIYDFIDHCGAGGERKTREDNVRQLGRRCLFDEEHGETVANLAILFYDALAKVELLPMDKHDREMLFLAALVHDLGKFLTYENHQIHSWYLIKNSSILGFDEDEIDMIAFLALSHRGTGKKRTAEIFELYLKSELWDFRHGQALGLVLETAELLESRRQGGIKGFEVNISGQKAGFVLTVRAGAKLVDELANLGRISKKFQNIFGLTLDTPRVVEAG
jgi:exopolyphosphatase/guanosine-5'-triphosphate,3'-diphosphate pyrophosphatase